MQEIQTVCPLTYLLTPPSAERIELCKPLSSLFRDERAAFTSPAMASLWREKNFVADSPRAPSAFFTYAVNSLVRSNLWGDGQRKAHTPLLLSSVNICHFFPTCTKERPTPYLHTPNFGRSVQSVLGCIEAVPCMELRNNYSTSPRLSSTFAPLRDENVL